MVSVSARIKSNWEVWTLIVGIAVFGAVAWAEVDNQLDVIQATAKVAQANTETLQVIVEEREQEKIRAEYEAEILKLRAYIEAMSPGASAEFMDAGAETVEEPE